MGNHESHKPTVLILLPIRRLTLMICPFIHTAMMEHQVERASMLLKSRCNVGQWKTRELHRILRTVQKQCGVR